MSDDKAQHEMISRCCAEVSSLVGDSIEIGVHRGDSALLIRQLLPDGKLFLCDTFTGMPDFIIPGLDEHRHKDFDDTSERYVQDKFANDPGVTIIPGIFPQSANCETKGLRFAHIDVDIYLSTLDALEWCWPRMIDGGIMLDDDYNCHTCRGAKRAVDEFAKRHGVDVEVMLNRAIIRRRTI